MPCFKLFTNASGKLVTDSVLKELSETLAKTVAKPEAKCQVVVLADQRMMMSGTTDICGTATFLSIGKLGPEENIKHSAAMMEVTEKRLGIPKDRLYIHFVDPKRTDMGFKGTTIDEVMKAQGL